MFGWFKNKSDVEDESKTQRADDDILKLAEVLKSVQLDLPSMDDNLDIGSDIENMSDGDILDELTALERGSVSATTSSQKPASSSTRSAQTSPLPKVVKTGPKLDFESHGDIMKHSDSLVESAILDVDLPIDDHVDETDPELLAELHALSQVDTIATDLIVVSSKEVSPAVKVPEKEHKTPTTTTIESKGTEKQLPANNQKSALPASKTNENDKNVSTTKSTVDTKVATTADSLLPNKKTTATNTGITIGRVSSTKIIHDTKETLPNKTDGHNTINESNNKPQQLPKQSVITTTSAESMKKENLTPAKSPKPSNSSTPISPQAIHTSSLAKQLLAQSDMSNMAAMKFLSVDQDRPMAMRWKRLSRCFAEQSAFLTEWKHGAPLSFHATNMDISYYKQCRDMDENIMEIQLGRMHMLSAPETTKHLFIQYEWTPSHDPTDPVTPLKGTKTVPYSTESSMHLTVFAKMERDKRAALARWCSRHKLNIEIYALTGGNAWLSYLLPAKKELIGRVSVPVSVLLRQCDVHDFAEIVEPRSKRGQAGSARLDVRLRMRRPIQCEEIIDEKCRFIVIDQDVRALEIDQLAEEINGIYVKYTSVPPVKAAVVEPAKVKAEPKKEKQAASQKKEKGEEDDDDDSVEKEDIYNVASVVSNDVLEWIKSMTEKELAMGKSQAGNKDLGDVEWRLSEVDSKLFSLQMRVQTGALTLADYLAAVENQIAMDGKLFLKVKQEGNIGRAKVLMKYIQIMRDEVKGAKESE